MKLFMYVSELRVGDVGVDLGGRDRRMAQEGLDGTDIGSVAEQIGGERVAQGVRGNIFAHDAGFGGIFADYSLDTSRGQAKVGLF